MSDLSARILDSARMKELLIKMALISVRSDLGSVASETLDAKDLNYSLTVASALTPENNEAAQDAILRIACSVLRNVSSSEDQRTAAMLLLDRVGNQPAISLAVQRFDLQPVDYSLVPQGLALDALARRSELSITDVDGRVTEVNPFQREFWTLVHEKEWVSVSAPTSAGKSHIVREWMAQELERVESEKLVYVAPTRALVEEVGAHFRGALDKGIGVHTLPWDPEIASFERQVFVVTQERLHLLQERSPSFSPDVIFVDEAQKVSDGTRGILLTQVLDEAILRNPSLRLVFASPLSSNPEVLFGENRHDKTTASIVGESVTVSQNLIYARQKPRHQNVFILDLHYAGGVHSIGEIDLKSKPKAGERVPYVAAAVGGLLGGNLVYANGAAEAEKYARLIYEELGDAADLDGEDIQDLIDFAGGTVHERFELVKYARRGVAFHYGDMPLVLKAKVEELFKTGALRYLVATSTLLEGVNLPCRNIFVRGPHKGHNQHMTVADFWNLAGRAGRWGKEFQGNIFCIDAHDERVWKTQPASRVRTIIVPAASKALNSSQALVNYIEAGAPKKSPASSPELESTFSWLAGRYLAHSDLDGLGGVSVEEPARATLQAAVAKSVREITVPRALIKRHAGISPWSMQRLYDAIVEHGHPENLTLVPPTSDGAKKEYQSALEFVSNYLGGSFEPDTRRAQLANLIVNWMSGRTLRRIIEGRAKYRRERGIEFNYPKLIRQTMADVENIARFEAPKYLSCYSDIVSAAAVQLGKVLDHQVIDIEMMLELGVPRRTDMSFIAVGLSRATCAELATYVKDPDLSPSACADWVRTAELEELDIPAFAAREIRSVRSLLAARTWS